MKENIQRIRDYVARIRRNPDASGSMNTLALAEVADCLESIDERLAKLEAIASAPPIVINPQAITADDLETLMTAPMAIRTMHAGDAARREEWAIGAKV